MKGAVRQLPALLALGLRLIRAGGVARWLTIIIGSALVSALLLTAYAVPGALQDPEVVIPRSERLKHLQLVILFAIPVLALLFTVLRLSSGTRDRRLASLRLIGLGPAQTRVVAVTEGATSVLLGALLGGGIFALVAKAAGTWGWGSQWIQQPLAVTWKSITVVVLLVVMITVIVAVSSTRVLLKDPRGSRSEAAKANLSRWRILPLLTGIGVLVWLLLQDHQKVFNEYGLLPDWWTLVMFGGWVVVGLSIPLVVPLFSSWIARWLGDQDGWLAGRLAGRRLTVEPASATRSVTGLALATYSSIIVLLFMAMVTQGSGKFVLEQSYLEQGPQPISLKVINEEQAAEISQADIAALEGVKHVFPRFKVTSEHETRLNASPAYLEDLNEGGLNPAEGVLCGSETGSFPCLEVVIGSCADYAQFRVITDCQEGTAQIASNAWQKGEGSYLSPSEVTLTGQRGQITLPLSETEVQVDLEATQARFLKGATVDEHILIPPTYAGVSKVLGPPRSYAITADGGRAVQVSLSQFAQQNGFEAVLPPSQTYEKTMLGRAALLTVIASIIGIGLLTVAVGLLDRTVERRRAVGSLVVIGVPVTTLRTSQLVQVLIPMVLSVALAVLTGSLSAQVFSVLLRFEGLGVGDPNNFTADILWVAIPLVIACIGVALATLPGLGARLRPEVLRRD